MEKESEKEKQNKKNQKNLPIIFKINFLLYISWR